MSEDEVLDFARRMFDLARDGETAELAAAIDAGVPVDLTNGSPSALVTAAFFDYPEMTELLGRAR